MDHELLVSTGINKYEMCKNEPMRFFLKAVVAGFYIGVATILSYSLAAMLFKENYAMAKIFFAGSFGLALVLIYMLGGELFTGNTFTTVMPVFARKLKLRQIMPMWVICYFGNFVGLALISYLFIISGVHHELLGEYVKSVASAKLDFDIFQLIIKAILCNFVVCVGGYAGYKIKDDVAKIIVIMLVVMAFLIPGFEHSIANMGLFTMAIANGGMDFSALPLHMLLATIGNIVGGSLLLGLPIFFVNKPKD